MASISLNRPISATLDRSAEAAAIPWYIWLSAIGVLSAMVGGQWDISWHQSIGRDTFWTPAHLAIQLCGVIAGITCGYLILATTFTKSPLRAASVNVLGFRGPLGAFISAWGGFTMITSAPFDDWWHNAYGLDVKILSPPHIVLALGLAGVQVGSLVLIGAMMNRAAGTLRRHLEILFLFICGMIAAMFMTVTLELNMRPMLHNPIAYRAVGLFIPLVIALAARSTGRRWAALDAYVGMEIMAAGPRRRHFISGHILGCRMALCGLFAVTCCAQSALRKRIRRLFPGSARVPAEQPLSPRHSGGTIRDWHGDSVYLLDCFDVDWPGHWRLVEKCAPLGRSFSRSCLRASLSVT